MGNFNEEEFLLKDQDLNYVKSFLYHFINSVDQACKSEFKKADDEFIKVGKVINKNADVLNSEITKLTEAFSTLASSLSELISEHNKHEDKIESLSVDIDLLKAKIK